MELTFITIHDITSECRILYASDSIIDVLGYTTADVLDKSTFDYFHEEDLPVARDRYKNEIEMNHASSLAYVRVRNNQGTWISCECVFSFVYDVIVAATTLYKEGPKSSGRAMAAPIVRQAFDASRRDAARYEMMAHLSAKFTSLVPIKQHEVRAAFILNRFTKSLTILYATHALEQLVGLQPAEAVGYSFFDCVDSDCIEGAVDAIDRAKQNDSVAYMRFRWKDPMQRRQATFDRHDNDSPDSAMTDDSARDNVHGREELDIESVVSCTSDGILVVLRRATPMQPELPPRGLFAVPWSTEPLYPAPPRPAARASSQDDAAIANDANDLNSSILTSIQEISAFVWALQVNPDVVNRYAQGTPGQSARPPTPDLTRIDTPSSEDDVPTHEMSGSSMPNAIEIDSD